jgi:hypothetical protein
MAIKYPVDLPCPMIEGYSMDVDAGLLRTSERGLPNQRRVFSTMPHSVKCKFTLSLKQWGFWQEWITRTPTSWFTIDLPSMYAGLHAQKTYPHLVRLASTVVISAQSSTHVSLSVTLEMAPSNFKQYLEAV